MKQCLKTPDLMTVGTIVQRKELCLWAGVDQRAHKDNELPGLGCSGRSLIAGVEGVVLDWDYRTGPDTEANMCKSCRCGVKGRT